jgi:hypothetical protein
MNAQDMYAFANQLKRQQKWAPDPDRTAAAVKRIVGEQMPSSEFATVDHVTGTFAYVFRAGQTTAIPVRVIGGLALVAGNKVMIERPHGSLNGAVIRTKVT